jgi:hypothetical protein
MQAFCCDVVRALTKLGIAIAARRPMMATTIMISTSVKPAVRVLRIFIVSSFFTVVRGVNNAAGGFVYCVCCSLIACRNRVWMRLSNHDASGVPACAKPESQELR